VGKPAAVGKDVSTCFHQAIATWTLGILYREKALFELPNGSIIKNSSSRPGTQGNRLTNEGKLAPTFNIGGLEKVLDITFEREEVTTLRWRTSEGCSPCIETGSSTLGLKSVKQSGWMASSSNFGTGSIFMCQEVKGPLYLAWTVPEVNGAIRVIGEEVPKARVTQAILNHAPIREFRQCFFPAECTQCLCGHCQMETHWHIFTNCHWFAHFPLTDLVPTVKDFVKFLKEHSSTFAFPSQNCPPVESPELSWVSHLVFLFCVL